MRALLALFIGTLAIVAVAPSASADDQIPEPRTVRPCNPADLPVWVDAGCYAMDSTCIYYWHLLWCSSCAWEAGHIVTDITFLLGFCLPIPT